MSTIGHGEELRSERAYLETLYRRLDAERDATAAKLGVVLGNPLSEGEQRWQREAAANHLVRRLSQLRNAENNLCFGRLDRHDGRCHYIGRIGLFDEQRAYRPLLMDWRAPAAKPFYCATAVNPEGARRRRHFRTSGRSLLEYHDDFLDAAGESTLLAALDAPREAAMQDIVATIQGEQDEIIRLGNEGVVVIEGGPGTGKTAVALHRVAYLLYHHRERLSRRGVLIVGPNPGFLTYIGQVLPSLGETDVVFATTGELFPGVRTTKVDAPDVARVKGDARMLDVLSAAVADREEVPDEEIEIELDDVTVRLDQEVATAARARARSMGSLHNQARSAYREALIDALAGRAVDRIGAGWLEPEDVVVRSDLLADVRLELSDHAVLHEVIDELWPELTPQRLLADLFSSHERLAAAGLGAQFYRADGDDWTVSDVPLLDEAVELLGCDRDWSEDNEQRRQQVEYARGVLDIMDTDEDFDDETLRAVDLIDSEYLAERHREHDQRSVAERAVEDREWAYGHVVLDEAQELSVMDWRMLMRRCPSRSMTVVGDLAQRQAAQGARSWQAMLGPYVQDRWTYRELTVNYRTPVEIMDLAAGFLTTVAPTSRVPRSVRSNGVVPWFGSVDGSKLSGAVQRLCEQARELPGTTVVIGPDGLELPANVSLRTPREVKGLEFDTVIVVEPQRVLAEGEHGAAELYVALTRATQRLWVLHTAPLPASLRQYRAQ